MYRDPTLRRWTMRPVESAEDAAQWLDVQRQGWETGERLSFAVLEEGGLVANVVLKRTGPDRAPGEVGYWTAAPARGRGVALGRWRRSPAGPSTPSRRRVWTASSCCTRWTISRRAASRRSLATRSTGSCPLGPRTRGTATCTCDGPTLGPEERNLAVCPGSGAAHGRV
ncbi:GNAT family N-acetyltransferase [Streptacidiphilus sp. MAP12-20]|uniref:GNAT family N-acetyltransferase n=1 Tax=Streptacidiphilus sp. MAP12-20 TaxID=3156299 RepID=UPI003515DB1F